jgi:hypothetical protein
MSALGHLEVPPVGSEIASPCTYPKNLLGYHQIFVEGLRDEPL